MRHKFLSRKTKKAAALVVATALMVACVGQRSTVEAENTTASSSTENSGTTKESAQEYSSERIGTNYTKMSDKYTLKDYTGEEKYFTAKSGSKAVGNLAADGEAQKKVVKSSSQDDKLYKGNESYKKSDYAIGMKAADKVVLSVEAPEDGLYYLDFDYLSYDESILPISLSMKVDGSYPFYECRNMKLETTWTNGEPSYDRYNNQVVAIPEKVVKWETQSLMDSSYRHSDPLKLELKKGKHTLELKIKEGTFLLGGVTLRKPDKLDAYTDAGKADGNGIVEIQGEDYSATNSSSIHGVVEFDSAITPYEVDDKKLNTLDSDAFSTAGQKVEYKFKVEKEGNYNIALNYRQSDKTDFPVFMDIAVDGKILNDAFKSYGMAYTTNYKTTTLQKDNKNLTVHLTPNEEHTISFTISMDNICYIMEELDEVMSEVNDLALEITKVAGNNADKYRDLKLSRYIPGLEEKLNGYADRLEKLEASAVKWSDSDKNVAVMSSMLIAAKQLRSLADNPDEIPYRIGELSTSTNSVNHYLATTIDNLIVNGVAIDRIWIYQDDAELPGAPGFFQSLGMDISRFVSSFTNNEYSTIGADRSHLQVWVNRSSQYVQIMQKMIDDDFTPKTGIDVDISIMPDQNKLVLANSAGNAPDVATGINYTVPYELAIRGALVDMKQFEGFKETANNYEPGFFLTGSIGDGVYSMPETMNFWVLFYRTDVMEKLGIEIPKTMDDVIDMLPTLQMRGLNFYYPTAGMLLMRNFHGTTPLIVQNGGSLYNDTANKGTAFGEEQTVKGFTTLTDLFTVYNMPVNVDNFYQHFRNGDMPIGIADYATFNMLTNAAPELEGSWEIALMPGTLKKDGSIDRSVCGCAESTVIFKSDSEREKKAWEFIKWWSSEETQAKFGQTIQISYGNDYIWPSANVKAFAQLPLEANSKSVIQQTASNVVDVARVPGTYLLEREVSNAFNDIVVNGQDERTRIDKAVKNVNHEFSRKLEEFGYIDSDGNTIKDYKVPTLSTVKETLGIN